ncbi:MAG: hypothetical protein ABIG11_07855, partial [bacterium]
TRFKKAYPDLIKPMVPVHDVPLIEWTVRLLADCGCRNFTVLLNERGRSASRHLEKVMGAGLSFRFIHKDTASSWESFRIVSGALAGQAEHFLMSAVDSLYEPEKLKGFFSGTSSGCADAVLGVTSSIEDEKPLWADIDATGRITALGPDTSDRKFATNGVYLMSRSLAERMPSADSYSALREYLTDLIRQDNTVWSWPMKKSVDVDDPADITAAEKFVKKYLSGRIKNSIGLSRYTAGRPGRFK